MAKINEVVAVEKGVKARVYGEITELHKASQKLALYLGFTKDYRKKDETGEDYPPERQKVQLRAEEVLAQMAKLATELFDIEATKDYANQHTTGTVTIDGVEIIKDAPPVFLLFLEKQLTDVRTFVEKIPALDEAEEWAYDDNARVYKTEPQTTFRTKKVQKPLVLVQPTKEHPGQAQLITEDELVGYWDLVKFSGCLPTTRKLALLERVETLLKAVKQARERASAADAPGINIGKRIFDYLLA